MTSKCRSRFWLSPLYLTGLVILTLSVLGGCERNGDGPQGSTNSDGGSEFVRRTPPEERPELETQLFDAISDDNEALAMELIEQGAPVHAVSDHRNVTVLHHAARMSMPNLVRLLLEYGADVHSRIAGVHHEPIHWAARAGCSDRPGRAPGAAEATIDVLLEYGADINAETEGGVKPITYAIEMNAPAWKEFLISRGAQE